MATLVGEKREGKLSIRSQSGVPILDETYHFLVRGEAGDERVDILLTAGVPQVGISTSARGSAVCKSTDANRRADQIDLWDVTATFSSEVDERQSEQSAGGGSGGGAEPVEWLPIYETKFERLQEATTTDAAGDAVANSAGQPFENGIMRARFVPIWEFFQFEPATVTDEQVIERNEVVNESAFKGRDAKTLLCTVLSSVIGFYYGRRLRLTRYALRYDAKKWTHKRLDVGTVYLDAGKHKPYLDDSGNVILGALDGLGAKQTPGTAPEVLEFDMYPVVSFASFLRI
jgi:hypothetical protein